MAATWMALVPYVQESLPKPLLPTSHSPISTPWLPAHRLPPLHRSVDFLLDSSLRKLYPSVEKPSSS